MKRALIAAFLMASGCTAAQKQAVTDHLKGIAARLDPDRVMACIDQIPEYKAVASCLAGVSIGTVTDELKLAIDKAADALTAKVEEQLGTDSPSRVAVSLAPAPDIEKAVLELEVELHRAIAADAGAI